MRCYIKKAQCAVRALCYFAKTAVKVVGKEYGEKMISKVKDNKYFQKLPNHVQNVAEHGMRTMLEVASNKTKNKIDAGTKALNKQIKNQLKNSNIGEYQAVKNIVVSVYNQAKVAIKNTSINDVKNMSKKISMDFKDDFLKEYNSEKSKKDFKKLEEKNNKEREGKLQPTAKRRVREEKILESSENYLSLIKSNKLSSEVSDNLTAESWDLLSDISFNGPAGLSIEEKQKISSRLKQHHPILRPMITNTLKNIGEFITNSNAKAYETMPINVHPPGTNTGTSQSGVDEVDRRRLRYMKRLFKRRFLYRENPEEENGISETSEVFILQSQEVFETNLKYTVNEKIGEFMQTEITKERTIFQKSLDVANNILDGVDKLNGYYGQANGLIMDLNNIFSQIKVYFFENTFKLETFISQFFSFGFINPIIYGIEFIKQVIVLKKAMSETDVRQRWRTYGQLIGNIIKFFRTDSFTLNKNAFFSLFKSNKKFKKKLKKF